MPELYSPTLIRREIYPLQPSTVFKAKQSLSSERGLGCFCGGVLGFSPRNDRHGRERERQTKGRRGKEREIKRTQKKV